MNGKDGRDGTALLDEDFESFFAPSGLLGNRLGQMDRNVSYYLLSLPKLTGRTLWRSDIKGRDISWSDMAKGNTIHDWFMECETEDGRQVVASFHTSRFPPRAHIMFSSKVAAVKQVRRVAREAKEVGAEIKVTAAW
jgi:hypothetical protein